MPGTPGDRFEDDFLLLSDVFRPASTQRNKRMSVSATRRNLRPRPVGLLAALSAKIKGASEIYVVDNVKERLDLVAALGATPVDFSAGDAVDQILAFRKPHRDSAQNLDPTMRSGMKRKRTARPIRKTRPIKIPKRSWPT